MKNVEKLVEQTVQAVKSCWKWTGNVYVMFGKSVNLHSWQVALENENVDLEKSLKNL